MADFSAATYNDAMVVGFEYKEPQVVATYLSVGSPVRYFQRVYDVGLEQYVYYTLSAVTASPDAGDTTPNHSGSLTAATHEILATLR